MSVYTKYGRGDNADALVRYVKFDNYNEETFSEL